MAGVFLSGLKAIGGNILGNLLKEGAETIGNLAT